MTHTQERQESMAAARGVLTTLALALVIFGTWLACPPHPWAALPLGLVLIVAGGLALLGLWRGGAR